MIARLLPIVLILIAAGLFFGYVNPTYTGQIASLKGEIASYDAALAAAQSFSDKEAQLAQERSAIPAEDEARVEAFLPDGVDNVQLILDLNALAARSGLTLANFDTEDVSGRSGGNQLPLTSEGPVESLNLTVSGVGSYKAFKTFLMGAERSLRPMDLVDLTVDDSPTGVYNYDMTFRIYWLR